MFPLLVLCSDSLWCVDGPTSFLSLQFPCGRQGPMSVRRKNRKGYMSGQVREDEFLAEAVVIDGGNERYWQPVSQTTCGQEPSVGDAKPTFQRDCTESICRPCPQEMGAVGRHRRPRVKAICQRTKPRVQKNQSCESCETKSEMENERKKPAVQFEAGGSCKAGRGRQDRSG